MQDLLAIMGLPGYIEIIIIVLVALILFGNRLPALAASLGRSIIEFKKGVRDVDGELPASRRDQEDSEDRR